MNVILLLCILYVMADGPNQADEIFDDNEPDDDADTLRLIQILYRHGDRSPTHGYTNDIYQESDWPQGYGQLSTVGMQQELELGEFLRQEFVDTGFLSPEYIRSEIYVRSTACDRTLMSAYSVLAGLYPPSQYDSSLNTDMNWQPIPVHTVPLEEDYLLRVDTACPVFNTADNNDPEKKAIQKEIMNEFSDFFTYVSKHSGEPNTWDGITAVIDPIFCQHASNFSLPEWITPDVLDQILQFYDIRSVLSNYPEKFVYLRGGSLVGEMLQHMINKSKRDPSTPQKLFMYSAHDTTIESFLATLEIFNDLTPRYTACVIVELHELLGQFFVRFLYKNETDNLPFILTIPDCDELCPLEKFAQIMEPSVPKNIREECGIDNSEVSAAPAIPEASSIVVIVELCLILVTIITVAVLCFVKRDRLANTHDYMPVPLEMS